MTDITVRLRRGFGGLVPPVCDEAANTIEDLRELVKLIFTSTLPYNNGEPTSSDKVINQWKKLEEK